jgi:hypothetical protein
MTDVIEFTPAIIGMVFMLGIYGAFKFAEQSWGSDPTKWDPFKYLQVFGAAILVTAVMYLASGVLTTATIEQITQALALLGGSVLTILGYKTAKNVSANGALINPAIKPTATTTGGASAGGWQPDFSVFPAAIRVMSGTPVTFTLQTVSPGTGPDTGIHRCKEVIIDWMDGTPLKVVPMGDGIVQVSKAYNYVAGTSEYDAHQFYPEFTTVDAYDGAKKSFNTEGRACAVEVVSLIPARHAGN